MSRKILPLLIFQTSVLILIGACAKISAPTGGKRDITPPVVVKSVPENGAKNFREKSLSVTFNEYVVLDNINDKFMVSPPMKKKPRVFLKGKSVVTEFEEKLKDSTTYTFYFQDAIRDLNEGNILDNYQFVISTGPVIDSLSVTGNVYNSWNLEVPEKTLVLMYGELADSAVKKHIPDYISRVDLNGYFRIDNVRAGIYKLYALKDGDNSKNYNLPDEEFAFMKTPVEATQEKSYIPVVKDTVTIKKGEKKVEVPPVVKSEYNLFLFTPLKKNHYLTSSNRTLKYQFIYTLSLPPDSMKFDFSIPGTAESSYILERSRNRDSLKVWLTDSTLYSKPQIATLVRYPFTDTLGITGYKVDTITMRFLAPRAPRVAKIRKPVFAVETNISSGNLKPGEKIIMKSQTPFNEPDTSGIRLYDITDPTRKKLSYQLFRDSLNSCRYFMNATLVQKRKYLYIADSASFSNIYNEHSDSTGFKFSVRDSESYSKLTLSITNNEGDRIIQLLNPSEKIVAEVKTNKDIKIVFPLLDAGFYRVRAIFDLNGDGKWTTGDFEAGRQPEPVTYYPSEIEIKTGWEVEQDWAVGAENFKESKLREKKKGN
jgi:hypothetical protein